MSQPLLLKTCYKAIETAFTEGCRKWKQDSVTKEWKHPQTTSKYWILPPKAQQRYCIQHESRELRVQSLELSVRYRFTSAGDLWEVKLNADQHFKVEKEVNGGLPAIWQAMEPAISEAVLAAMKHEEKATSKPSKHASEKELRDWAQQVWAKLEPNLAELRKTCIVINYVPYQAGWVTIKFEHEPVYIDNHAYHATQVEVSCRPYDSNEFWEDLTEQSYNVDDVRASVRFRRRRFCEDTGLLFTLKTSDELPRGYRFSSRDKPAPLVTDFKWTLCEHDDDSRMLTCDSKLRSSNALHIHSFHTHTLNDFLSHALNTL